MDNEKKKGLALVLGMGGEGDAHEEEHEDEGFGEGLRAAAEEAMQALKDDDIDAFQEALTSFVDLRLAEMED